MNGCKRATALLAFGFCSPGTFAQITNLSIIPEADAFVRAAAPLENYGRAGSLAVGGASATNGFGLPGGRFETLLRFPLVDTVALLDTAFGHRNWFIARAALRLNEVAAPANAIFPRGAVGTFEVRRLTADAWAEGTGSPSVPTNDGASYQALSSLFDPQRDTTRPADTWTNLFTKSAQPFDNQVEVHDEVSNAARFYRPFIAPQ